jgi:hypothetical protein
LPVELDVTSEAIAEQKIERSVSEDLIGDIGVAYGDYLVYG